MSKRTDELSAAFRSLFKTEEAGIWSAPGRTEIGGNHTDHQHGKVLAGSVDADMLAAAALNGSDLVRIQSEGYPMMELRLDKLEPVESEKGTTAALVRGMCAQCAGRGFPIGGFDACVCSDVPQGKPQRHRPRNHGAEGRKRLLRQALRPHGSDGLRLGRHHRHRL